ncbi:hypothetical protein CSZ94_06945 [Janthinobacterium sp. ROICE36]|uniref:zonular occludens toxin domain-containing protein n=1 Tax=Janthinobacterium sp. ROICE36 TaxID=2048670 RepID=UPI000C7EB3FF|nr:zonular occludens toxin domain-containing protein [Janthinobacterium sp. ROICE36]PLY44077.1 hypothetical protein CSZ94_06945 [Janthinobacterium sp. ROICE36]
MPINAFGGGPGSGKTYGVMEHVILPAVAAGRFIITNIDGLNVQAIYDYVVENYYKDKIICIGHIRTCSRSAPGEPGFFPGDSSLDKPCGFPDPERTTVAGGDLVVIDEATRYWPQGEKVSKEAAFFFREHRHFSNDLGQTCDLVVIDPDLTLLARPLKGKIELSSITHKPKGLGLNRYVVRLFRGSRVTGAAKPQSINGPYPFKPEIYALYKSYSHDKASEQPIDKRQNIFRNKVVWLYLGGGVCMLFVSVVLIWRFFNPDLAKGRVASKVVGSIAGSGEAVVPGAVGASSAAGIPQFSTRWRVVGSYTARGQSWVVLADDAGRLRHESPGAFMGSGSLMVGDVDGSRATTYSGSVARSAVIPVEVPK